MVIISNQVSLQETGAYCNQAVNHLEISSIDGNMHGIINEQSSADSLSAKGVK